jgi:multidrug resistance efflux pump
MQTTRHPQTDALERRHAQISPRDRDSRPRPARRTRWLVALGFTLLAASAIGTWVVLNSHAHDDKAVETSPAPDNVAASWAFGHVDIEDRVAELYPRLPEAVPNVVTEVLVKENDFVKKGAPLLRLDSRPARFTVQKAEANLKDAKLQLEQAKTALPQHESMLAAKQKAVDVAKEEVNQARLNLKEMQRRYNASAEVRLVSKDQVDIAEATVSAAEKKVQAAQADVDALDKRRQFIQFAADRAEQDVTLRTTQLEQAKFAESLCELKAPFDGTVLRLLVTVGQLLGPQPREPIIYFCPNTPRIIRAEVDQESAGQIQIGQAALITDSETLKGTIPGTVKRISDWFAQRRSPLFEPRQLNDVRTLECIIEVAAAEAKDLRIGQRVRVKIEKKK